MNGFYIEKKEEKISRVLLISPRVVDTPNHPLGLLYIASALEKNNYDVKVIDTEINESVPLVIEKIIDYKPNIIGISATTVQINFALEISKNVKKRINVPIIMGGVHPTADPERTIKHEYIDYLIIGEGEITMLELCDYLTKKNKKLESIRGIVYKKDGTIKINRPRELIKNLDSLPFPARHLLPQYFYFAPPRLRGVWTKSTVTIMASRGCPYCCSYCASRLIFGRNVRFRSPESVVAEIEHCIKKYCADSVWFADDTFTVNKEWVKRLCSLIKTKKWKNFRWVCQARVNTVDEEILKIMKDAGCVQVDFGVESGSSRVLGILNKGITIPQIINAFDVAKKVGLLRCATFIVGTPGETEEDLKLTEKIVLRIKPDFTEFYFMTPYPFTDIYNSLVKKGFLKENYDLSKWFLTKHIDTPPISITIPEKRLIYWRSRLHNKIVLRNYLTFLKSPFFVLGALKIFFNGFLGLKKGVNRFFKTKKIDVVFHEILVEHRRKNLKRLIG